MRVIIFVFLCFLGVQASADIYLEPYVGFMEGTVKADETVTLLGQSIPLSASQNEHGTLFGAKLGLSYFGLSFGGEYMGGQPVSGGSGAPLNDIGAFVGFTFPVFLKISAAYFFSSTLGNVSETDANNIEFTEKAKGKGYKVSLGFTFLPLIVINLDYIAHVWDNIPLEATVTAYKITDTAGMLSLSLPLSF